jgi:hypothetical protein
LLVAFRDGYLGQPPEQLIGVKGTISTYLEYFLSSEISEVFCANEPTFSVHQIDDGKIVSVAMPQKFQSERLYINTILTQAIILLPRLEPIPAPVHHAGAGRHFRTPHIFPPELIGRFDEKIAFKPLPRTLNAKSPGSP